MPPTPQQQIPTTAGVRAPKNGWKIFLIVSTLLLLILCGVGFWYWSGTIKNLIGINQTKTQITNTTSGWQPAATLLSANIGFTATSGELYFNGQDTGRGVNQVEVWVFPSGFSLPTYGIDERTSPPSLVYIAPKVGVEYDTGIDYGNGGPVILDSVATFEALQKSVSDNSCGYTCTYDATNQNLRYFKGEVYPPLPTGGDATTFSVLYGPDGSLSGFAKDTSHLYQIVEGGEATGTFAVYDKSFDGITVDAASFQVLGGGYFKDKNNVFSFFNNSSLLQTVPNADASTFRYSNSTGDIGVDARHAYVGGVLIPNADPLTFVPVTLNPEFGEEFYKDKTHVFYSVGAVMDSNLFPILIGADPATFTYNDSTGLAKDATHVWIVFFGVGDHPSVESVANADSSTFTTLGGTLDTLNPEYAKDKNSVYYLGGAGTPIVSGADPATFTLENPSDDSYDAQDKNHKYLNGQVVQ